MPPYSAHYLTLPLVLVRGSAYTVPAVSRHSKIVGSGKEAAGGEAGADALARLVFFSDAVFAIAITLLVLEIDVPRTVESDLSRALGDLWPQFLSFALSFVVIGLFWVGHHRLFRYIVRFDDRLLWLNLALLLCIAFLPFPTALVGEHEGNRVAVVFYACSMAVTGAASASVWRYASHRRRLLEHTVDERQIRYLFHRALVVPTAFLTSVAVALGSPRAAEALWLLTFPTLVLLRRAHR
jgi:uncharacterized membrane protein